MKNMKNINNINHKEKTKNKNALFFGVFFALFGAFAYANAQEQGQNQEPLEALPDGARVDVFEPTDLEAPPVSPLAVEQLQQNINRPSPSLSNQQSVTTPPKDETTYFKNTALDQARLTSLKLQNAIDKELMAGERERMKFLEEGGILPGEESQQVNMANPNLNTGQPFQGQGQPFQGQGINQQAVEVEEKEEFVKPKLRGVYSYGDTTYAEMIVGGRKALVKNGMTLSDGSKVVRINPMEVTVSFEGETHRIPLEGGAVTE